MAPRALFVTLLGLSCLLVVGCGSDGGSDPGDDVVMVDGVDTQVVEVRLPLQGDSAPGIPKGLVNQNGEPAGFESLPEDPVFLAFIYTRCPEARMCPLITRRMKALHRDLRAEDDSPASFLLATLDPAHDTPAVLRRYAERHDLDPSSFELWTGPPPAVAQLHDRYNMTALRPDGTADQPLVHNLRLYLIDRERTIRGIWTGNDWEPDEVLERYRSL